MKRHPLAIAIAIAIDLITALSWFVAQVARVVVVVMVMLCASVSGAAADFLFFVIRITAFVI